eukprot:gene18551-25058_t
MVCSGVFPPPKVAFMLADLQRVPKGSVPFPQMNIKDVMLELSAALQRAGLIPQLKIATTPGAPYYLQPVKAVQKEVLVTKVTSDMMEELKEQNAQLLELFMQIVDGKACSEDEFKRMIALKDLQSWITRCL